MKTCKECGLTKELSEFTSDGKGKTGLPRTKPRCKPCHNAYTKAWRDNHADKDALRASWRKAAKKNYSYERSRNAGLAKYGLTPEQYNEMFERQEGKCKVCKEEIKLVVDHCHTTGEVRGLLCNGCNTGLGLFKDSIDRLEEAVVYLKSSRSRGVRSSSPVS